MINLSKRFIDLDLANLIIKDLDTQDSISIAIAPGVSTVLLMLQWIFIMELTNWGSDN